MLCPSLSDDMRPICIADGPHSLGKVLSGISMVDWFDVDFHPLVIDDSAHGLVDGHGLDSSDFERLDQDRILNKQ